jgi:hypothetical protein
MRRAPQPRTKPGAASPSPAPGQQRQARMLFRCPTLEPRLDRPPRIVGSVHRGSAKSRRSASVSASAGCAPARRAVAPRTTPAPDQLFLFQRRAGTPPRAPGNSPGAGILQELQRGEADDSPQDRAGLLRKVPSSLRREIRLSNPSPIPPPHPRTETHFPRQGKCRRGTASGCGRDETEWTIPIA